MAGPMAGRGGRMPGPEPGCRPAGAWRLRAARRRHGRLPGRQHHGGPDVWQDRRELHTAPLPWTEGPLHQRGLGRRHGGRRAEAAGARRPRPRRDGADRRLRGQRHRLGPSGQRRAQAALSRLDPRHRRQVAGSGRAGLHRLGGDHRRGSRQGRTRLPPGDVRRGDGARPVDGRALDRHRAHDANDPAASHRGQRHDAGEGPGQPARRRRRPPERPGATGDGLRDPRGARRAGGGLRRVDRRLRPAGYFRGRVQADEPLRPPPPGRSSSTGSTTACPSTSASSGPCNSATSRSPTSWTATCSR